MKKYPLVHCPSYKAPVTCNRFNSCTSTKKIRSNIFPRRKTAYGRRPILSSCLAGYPSAKAIKSSSQTPSRTKATKRSKNNKQQNNKKRVKLQPRTKPNFNPVPNQTSSPYQTDVLTLHVVCGSRLQVSSGLCPTTVLTLSKHSFGPGLNPHPDGAQIS